MSYQLDLFGQIRRAVEAASGDEQAARAAYDATRVTVAAETARAYANMCAAGMQLASARHSLEVQKSSLDAIERLQRAGRGTALDVTRARSQLQQLQANLPPFQAQQRTALYRLAALTGRTPAQIPASLLQCATAPRLTQTIPVGDGAALLRRRPDIRQAERSLAAATARIGVATADLYPKISLGLSGASGGPAAMFGDRGTFSWSIGPLISWTIPNTGAAQARIAQAEAGAKAAAARFDAAVLNALRETESALTVYARQLDRERAASRARQSAQAASQARQLFQYGKTDYLTVLDAERTLAANESAGGGPPNSAATRSPCSWRWAAAGRTGRTRPPALSPPSTPAGAKIGRFRLIPPPAGASLQAFRLHGRPAALPLFPAPAARLHCIAGRLLQHAQAGQAAGTRHRRGRQHAALQLQADHDRTDAGRARRRRPGARARYPASDAAQLRDACAAASAGRRL